MITRRKLIQSGAGLLATSLMPAMNLVQAASPDYGIKGYPAPELKATDWIDAKGKPSSFQLADHSGKWVFLKCFQSWCPGCHAHGFPALKKISDALADNPNVAFASIQTVFEGSYVNTVDKVREIQLRYDLNLPMGHDDGGDAGRSLTMMDYRTGGTPWMILITPDRHVVYNDFGIDADKAIQFLNEVTKAS